EQRAERVSHPDPAAVEEPSMRTCRPEEVVPPVGRRPDHEVVALEERKRAGQELHGHMGAVAIERDDTPAPRAEKDVEGGLESGRRWPEAVSEGTAEDAPGRPYAAAHRATDLRAA